MMGGRRGQSGQIDVYLSKSEMLRLLFPPVPFHRSVTAPLTGVLFIIIVIGLTVFLLVRKTLKPVDKIIRAAERVGEGDLTYRIQHDRDDDFKKVANAFNSMTERLWAMLTNQRELLHLISHELRTPLTRISLALEVKDRKKSQNVIQDEIKEIDMLVENVLDLSRMDSARYRDVQSVDIVAIIKGVVEKYGSSVRFTHDMPEARVNGNELLLKKAFSNLVENAVKYSEGGSPVEGPLESPAESPVEGPVENPSERLSKDRAAGPVESPAERPVASPVEIALTGNGKQYRVTFKNCGPGVTEVELPKIWEPFFRGRNARIDETPGKGLGLVIVKKAIELSGGSVTVESRAAGPTVFTVLLHE
jgi:signal transduction histidine kinase